MVLHISIQLFIPFKLALVKFKINLKFSVQWRQMFYLHFLNKIDVAFTCFLSALLTCFSIVLDVAGLNFERLGEKDVEKVNEENDSD